MNTVQKDIVSLLNCNGVMTERQLGRELQIAKGQISGHVSHINKTTAIEISILTDNHGKRSYKLAMMGERKQFN